MRILFFFLFLFYLSVTAFAQNPSLPEIRDQITEAANAGDVEALHEARAAAERIAQATSDDPEHAAYAHYYAAYASMGLVNAGRGAGNGEDQLVKRLDAAIEHLQQAIELNEAFAEAHALLSSAYGQKIGFNPMSGMWLGPKSNSAIAEAKRFAPDNPRVVLVEAISQFNTPKMWGGGKEKAMTNFQRAADLFETWTTPDALAPTWGHDETYAWIGLAHLDADRPDEARTAFEQALELNPDNNWVRYSLLPQVK